MGTKKAINNSDPFRKTLKYSQKEEIIFMTFYFIGPFYILSIIYTLKLIILKINSSLQKGVLRLC